MAPFSPFPRAHPRGKNCGGTAKKQVVNNAPVQPLDSARHAPRRGVGTNYRAFMPEEVMSMKSLVQLEMVGARSSRAAPGRSDPLLR
jgi:hypothetical protein